MAFVPSRSAVAAASILAAFSAVPTATASLDRTAVGVFVHDRGPLADRHESGLDLNVEFRFAMPGGEAGERERRPQPHLGITLNTKGETNAAYGGLTWEWDVSRRLFAALGLGLALHDGPLGSRDREACRERSDCGFGSRVLFRGSLEFGGWLDERNGIALHWDHISHYGLLAEENEGIDTVGLRWHRRF